MARHGATHTRVKPTASRLVTLFALAAFFLQSLVIQTHIHQLVQPLVAKVSVSSTPAHGPLKTQDPADQNSCRLCQELLHSGAFITPTVSTVAASLNFVTQVFAAPPSATALGAPGFAWQSRAPPRP